MSNDLFRAMVVARHHSRSWYFFAGSDAANELSADTSLVKLDDTTAVVFYECFMVTAEPGVVGKNGQFSMRVGVA